MGYIFYIIIILFLYINFKIVYSDIKTKKIPNKYLIYLLVLLPFSYIFTFVSYDINLASFFIQTFLAFLVSFLLFYFWLWAAWDAKYLLVLSLYIPQIGIVPFIWNIALITLAYLIAYFFWFYLGKCFFYKWHIKNIIYNIKLDLKEKWINYKKNKWWNNFSIILNWLLIFLIIFTCIRLSRIYLFNELITENQNWFNFINTLIQEYHFYLIFWFILIFLAWLFLVIKVLNIFKEYFKKISWIKTSIIQWFFVLLLSILLWIFIFKQYLINPEEIINSLVIIFTLYILIYITFKVLVYSYKLTFWISEMIYINIKNLKIWDIIDKNHLIQTFWKQDILIQNKNLFESTPTHYFYNIELPLEKKDVKKLQKIYKIVSDSHIKHNIKALNNIRILKVFAFAPYIFIWFLVTYFLDNKVILYISNYLLEIIKKLTIS